MEMNEMNNVMGSVEMNNIPANVEDVQVSNNGINLKAAGFAGLAAVVVGAVAYYGYKKYKDHKATATATAEESK